MMMVLQKLSSHMNKVYDGGKDSAGEIERAIALLGGRREGVKDEGPI
jgi:hypothetical protein